MNEYIEKVMKGEPVNKVDFLYGKHKILWGILSEWEGLVNEEWVSEKIKVASLLQKEAVMERMDMKQAKSTAHVLPVRHRLTLKRKIA